MSRTLLVACGWALTVGLSAHDHPLHPFSENKGQWPEQVLYRTLVGQGGLFVERDALTYVLRSGGHQHAQKPTQEEQPLREHAFRVRFEGGEARSYGGTRPLSYYENYFLGNDSRKWASGVPVFEQVDLRSLYPGIDLQISGTEELKYDLLVDAGADPAQIVMHYEGQDGLQLLNGSLRISTTAGDVLEHAPVAWQEVKGRRMEVPCAFALDGDRVHFIFPKGYDKRAALVIDPVISFCSYTGSTADNFGFTATYDATGHLYAGGIVFGIGYPITPGVQQPNFGGNTIDVGLTKFAPDGTSLIWSTYLGSANGNESPHSLVVNSDDELYVMGITGGSDFPTTAGCFDNTFGAGPAVFFFVNEGYLHNIGTDIFVTHFNSTATAIIGSTYVGGSQADGLNNSNLTAHNYGDPFRGEIVLDGQERPVVASCTMSTDIPTTAGAAFPTYAGGEQDGYVFAMDPGLTTQLFATFYGGTGTDACYAVQLDDNDEVFATGGSNSGDLPMAGTPFDNTGNGDIDGFVIRLSPNGNSLLSSTYLGTPQYDQAYFVQLDTNNNVYVVGQTHGAYPITPGKYNTPNSSQFIQKLDHALSSSIWSTVIGSGTGAEDISPAAFLVSDCGQIYFSGWGGTTNQIQQAFSSTTFGLPTTSDAFQTTTDGSDFYLLVLNQEANSLAYATFFGGSISAEHVDGGTSRFSKTGVVYQAVCAGCGGNSDLPTTPGAWSQTNNSNNFNCNLGVFKMDFEQGVTANIGGDPLTGCAPATINFTSTGSGTSWHWDFGDGTPGSTLQNPSHLYPDAGTYPVTLIAVDSASCNISDTLTINIVILPSDTLEPTFTMNIGPCGTYLVTFTNTTPGIGNSYSWTLGDGGTANSSNVTHTYPGPGTYIVTLSATDPTCNTTGTVQDTITLTTPATVDALFAASSADFCSGLSITAVDESTGPPGMILSWDMGDGTTLNGSTVQYTYNAAGTYTITLTAFDPNCNQTDTYSMPIDVVLGTGEPGTFIIPNVFSPNGDLKNETFFPVPGASSGYVHLMVFNRWGMKLYETGSTFQPWNGYVRPGEKAPEGVYYYILDYRLPCNGTELKGQEKGHVQLLR